MMARVSTRKKLIEDMLDEVRNSTEDPDRVEALIAVSRDLRNTANLAVESFWKTAKSIWMKSLLRI